MLMANEAAQNTHISASKLGDVAGALGHAPTCVSIFTQVTTLAHTPAMHNNPCLDAFGKGRNHIVNSLPRCEHHPTQPVGIKSSTKLSDAEDINLPARQIGQHYCIILRGRIAA